MENKKVYIINYNNDSDIGYMDEEFLELEISKVESLNEKEIDNETYTIIQ
jgi:hypothetical protein